MITAIPLTLKPTSLNAPSDRALGEMLGTASAWVDFSAPTPHEIEQLSTMFKFHRVSIEDCLDQLHYPKVEEFPNYLFVIIHTLEIPQGVRFRTAEVDFFITPRHLVTVHQHASPTLELVQRHLSSGALATALKPDLLFHAIASRYVYEYVPVLEIIDKEIDAIEDAILLEPSVQSEGSSDVIRRILKTKKRLTYLKRLLAPQRDVFSRLGRGEFSAVGKVAAVYCRDLYDSLFRTTEMLDTFRDVLASTLEAYLSVVSNRLNQVMKVLTVVTVVILPLTLVTGIYGMNFRYMPELASPLGYPWSLALMLVIALGLVWYFKRRRWL